ncbi:THUMP domain-containing protein 1 [Sparganum proliferum]
MNSKAKRKAFYRRCAVGERRAKQRRMEAAGEIPESPLPHRYIEPGMTGVLVTYNNREDHLARAEAYRLLNEAHERLICSSNQASPNDPRNAEVPVPPASENNVKNEEDADRDADDDDVVASLRKELVSDQKRLRDPSKFLFHAVKTGVANCLFVLNQSKNCSSAELVHEVFRHVLTSGQANSRRILRFQPVAATCRPEVTDLKNLVRHVWCNWLQLPTGHPTSDCRVQSDVPPQRMAFVARPPEVSDGGDLGERRSVKPFTFTVNFKSRSSDRLSKPDAVAAVIAAISEVSPDWSPVCAAADVVVSVDVIRNVACLSLLEKFTEFWKYNLHELSPVT